MPSYKWTGSNEQGFVSMGGKKFEKDVPVEVDDPALGAKLDGNGEFEQVSGASGTEAPLFSPPGPTGIGTGPGTGPYQTTNEVIDPNPNPDAGQPTEEERQKALQAEANPDQPDEPSPEATEEGPKRKRSKASSEPPAESA